jgi:hypothetical protein
MVCAIAEREASDEQSRSARGKRRRQRRALKSRASRDQSSSTPPSPAPASVTPPPAPAPPAPAPLSPAPPAPAPLSPAPPAPAPLSPAPPAPAPPRPPAPAPLTPAPPSPSPPPWPVPESGSDCIGGPHVTPPLHVSPRAQQSVPHAAKLHANLQPPPLQLAVALSFWQVVHAAPQLFASSLLSQTPLHKWCVLSQPVEHFVPSQLAVVPAGAGHAVQLVVPQWAGSSLLTHALLQTWLPPGHWQALFEQVAPSAQVVHSGPQLLASESLRHVPLQL